MKRILELVVFTCLLIALAVVVIMLRFGDETTQNRIILFIGVGVFVVMVAPAHLRRRKAGRLISLVNQNSDLTIPYVTKLIQSNPKNPDWYSIRGVAYVKKKEYEPAYADFETAIALAPQLMLPHSSYAIGLITEGRYGAALVRATKAVNCAKRAQDKAGMYSLRGRIYTLIGDTISARNDFERGFQTAADKMPDVERKGIMAGLYLGRGQAYFVIGDFERSLRDFHEAQKLQPKSTEAIAGQAVTQLRMGNVDEAKRLWRSLIAIDEKYKDAEALREEYHCAEAMVEAAREIIAGLE